MEYGKVQNIVIENQEKKDQINMKIRNGFVSNSSSSSFTIIKGTLTKDQIKRLLEYPDSKEDIDGWEILEEADTISGSTVMDNDAIDSFINSLHIPEENIIWERL